MNHTSHNRCSVVTYKSMQISDHCPQSPLSPSASRKRIISESSSTQSLASAASSCSTGSSVADTTIDLSHTVKRFTPLTVTIDECLPVETETRGMADDEASSQNVAASTTGKDTNLEKEENKNAISSLKRVRDATVNVTTATARENVVAATAPTRPTASANGIKPSCSSFQSVFGAAETAPPSTSHCSSLSHMPLIRHPNDRSAEGGKNTTVPEFLYQLMKMLCEGNSDVIEWGNGKIMVHDPHNLESDILGRYFRHSKYASFQRQLNYFGFRKMAGKGKMAPCSYVNDEVTKDVTSLLSIKRKPHGATGGRLKSTPDDARNGMKVKQGYDLADSSVSAIFMDDDASNSRTMHLSRDAVMTNIPCVLNQPEALAQSAAGKGVKHFFNGYLKELGSSLPRSVSAMHMHNLLELEKNFRRTSAENDASSKTGDAEQTDEDAKNNVFAGGLRAESMASLVDLAMIPLSPDGKSTFADAVATESTENDDHPNELHFIDFPTIDWKGRDLKHSKPN